MIDFKKESSNRATVAKLDVTECNLRLVEEQSHYYDNANASGQY